MIDQSVLDSAALIEWNEEFRLWWPASENAQCFKHMLWRVTDCDIAAKHCKTLAVAVQAGGFIGMWPARLGRFFERVYSFEPVPHLYQCAVKNTNHLPHVRMFNAALSDKMGEIEVAVKRGGCTRACEGGGTKVPTLTIDSLALPRCDLIYLDIERHELQALEGARKTIEEFRPVIVLETKEDTFPQYQAFMERFRYSRAVKTHGDVVFTP